jgi:PAS domain S-box-containing protein
MKIKILDLIDIEKVDTLLEGFNKSTGFVTAILDLNGNILSKSGWRQICTQFHRINPDTSKRCTISDTVIAGKLAKGENYHFYKCLNGLVDVAVPVVINGEHIANLFSGQFFFEQPDISFFKEQAKKYGFDEEKYIKALEIVPVVSKEKVKIVMDFLLNMTQLISETTFQKLEQMELNKTIRESEERFSTIFKSSPIAISIACVSDGKLTDVNDTWCQLMGFSAEEALGFNVGELKIIDEDTRNKIREEFLRNGKLSQLENIISTKTGEQKSVLTSAEKITINGNQFSINLVVDITERKQAEEKLRESERHVRNSQQIANLGSWRLDVATNQVTWTEELYKMYGFDPSKPPPSYTEHMKLFTPASWEKLSSSLANTRETGIPYVVELETIKKDGSHGWMWARGEVTKDSDGNTIGLWGAAQDITERKRSEEEIRRLNSDLEKRVSERTDELRRLVNAMAGREVRMAELKDVIYQLRAQLEQSGLTPVANDPLMEH